MGSTYPATVAALQVVMPGIDMVYNMPTPELQLAARQQLGLPEAGQGILFVGNDYRKKGLSALLNALARLPENIWLAVVGNAAQIPEFQAQAKVAGVFNRVTFLGALSDVGPAYVAADCLAHPTLEDTFAMVVLEAMAHRLPVVVSSESYCGISGLLTHEVNALILTNPRDFVALAEALRRVLLQPSLRQNLRAAAAAFANAHQWSAIAAQQEKIYFTVMNAGSADS